MSSVEATIINAPSGLVRARKLIADLATSWSLSREVVFELNVVLDEIISNIIKYGYTDDESHEIRLRLAVTGEVLEVEVEDDGQPFNPLNSPAPDLTLPSPERPVGGLGLRFVRSLMNEVDYSRVANHNRVILRRRLNR